MTASRPGAMKSSWDFISENIRVYPYEVIAVLKGTNLNNDETFIEVGEILDTVDAEIQFDRVRGTRSSLKIQTKYDVTGDEILAFSDKVLEPLRQNGFRVDLAQAIRRKR